MKTQKRVWQSSADMSLGSSSLCNLLTLPILLFIFSFTLAFLSIGYKSKTDRGLLCAVRIIYILWLSLQVHPSLLLLPHLPLHLPHHLGECVFVRVRQSQNSIERDIEYSRDIPEASPSSASSSSSDSNSSLVSQSRYCSSCSDFLIF